jgi:ABC-type cobalamin/Fe3+-siderophores transport system ATPase subunit
MVLDQGRLVASGAPAEVLTPELIGRVFHVEARFAEGLSLHLPPA